MQQTTTALQKAITPDQFDLATGYPELWDDTRLERLLEIQKEVMTQRPKYDPHHPVIRPSDGKTRWIMMDLVVPTNQRTLEYRLLREYWALVARGTHHGAEQVINKRLPTVCFSASLALDIVSKTLLARKAKSVWMVRPSLDIFPDLLRSHGISVASVSETELGYTGANGIKSDFRQRAEKEKPSAIIIISPSNPTGSYIGAEALKRLANFCREKKIPLVMDSVFRGFHSKPYDDLAILEKSGCTYAVIGDTGKTVPALGRKVGFILSSADWYDAIAEKANLFGQVPFAELMFLQHVTRDLHIQNRNDGILSTGEKNRELLRQTLAGTELNLLPSATKIGFGLVQLPDHWSSAEFTDHLRANHKLAVVDTTPFYWKPDRQSPFMRALRSRDYMQAVREVVQNVRKIKTETIPMDIQPPAVRVSLLRPSEYFQAAMQQMASGISNFSATMRPDSVRAHAAEPGLESKRIA